MGGGGRNGTPGFFQGQGLNGEKKRMSPGLQLVENTTEETEEKNKIKPGRIEFVPSSTSGTRPDYSIFVGELTPEVDDFQLYDYFLKRYPSCIDCKIATDLLGYSRLKAEFQRYQSYNYNDYYQDYQNYYSQWGYDPYAEYNYSSYTPYDSMQAVGDCSLGDAVMTPAVFEETSAMTEINDDLITEDPQLYLDVDEMNRQFMETSEELYDSLMNCHWQPLDTVTSDIPPAI